MNWWIFLIESIVRDSIECCMVFPQVFQVESTFNLNQCNVVMEIYQSTNKNNSFENNLNQNYGTYFGIMLIALKVQVVVVILCVQNYSMRFEKLEILDQRATLPWFIQN